jgi:hypothetical protein
MTAAPRDNELRQIETQIRQAVRDAVNRNSRKPFYWGGLAEAISNWKPLPQHCGGAQDSRKKSAICYG